jgi:Rod binding domain-containing protein
MSMPSQAVSAPVDIGPPARVTLKDNNSRIRQAATDFEAMLLAQMLRSAREASGNGLSGDDEEDQANSTMLELGEQQFAQALASSGALGIAKMVVAGLTKNANR